ncbi:MAG: hypothetical protein SFV54_15900 [Bryobacteraceae bacterium]|nr:hypothetical protein [Bryobacteraceae bacterium]
MSWVMRHSRFKYFHDPDHAQQFLDGGMFCCNAAYYRDYEDARAAQVVGDEYEGTRLYRPLNGLEMTNLTQNTRANLKLGAEFITKAHEIFVYCVSMSFSEALEREFEAKACVEICHPRKFIERWHSALPAGALVTSGAVGDYPRHVCRMVRYYEAHDLPRHIWAIPDLLTTTKLRRFAYQEEYRFAYTVTDAFKFENVQVQLVDRKARPAPKPDEHFHQTLHLGDLHDICRRIL